VAGDKRAVADLGAWLVFEDESGQGLRPPKGRTWGRRGQTPVVTVTGGSNKRVSLAALTAVRAGSRPRLACRVHAARRGDKRKGFTEAGCARLLDAARQQLGGPLVLVWDNLSTRASRAMAALVAARDWLTVFQLPAYASELNPVESVWALLKEIASQPGKTQPQRTDRARQDPAQAHAVPPRPPQQLPRPHQAHRPHSPPVRAAGRAAGLRLRRGHA
jgi:putative transposase